VVEIKVEYDTQNKNDKANQVDWLRMCQMRRKWWRMNTMGCKRGNKDDYSVDDKHLDEDYLQIKGR